MGLYLLNGLQYLWMLVFIMVVAGIAKEHQLFNSMFAYLQSTVHSNRLVVALVSAVSGILPIEGRVTVSAGVLDTICAKHDHSRHKMGIVDYLSTHHYYLWSPLEKTVILPIAAFGITYAAWVAMIWPVLVITFAYIIFYIVHNVKESDINIIQGAPFKISAVLRNVIPFFAAIGVYIYTGGSEHVFAIFGTLALYYCFLTQTWNYKTLLSYMNWSVLATVAGAIILGNYFKTLDPIFKAWVSGGMFDMATVAGVVAVSSIGFIASFLMGSSGKYVAFAVLLSQLYGVEYFLWFLQSITSAIC